MRSRFAKAPTVENHAYSFASIKQKRNSSNKLLIHIGTHLNQLGLISLACLEDDESGKRIGSNEVSVPTNEHGKTPFAKHLPDQLDSQPDGDLEPMKAKSTDDTVELPDINENETGK